MKTRINWARFLMAFLVLETVILVAGCSAAWIGALQGMIPAIETIVNAAVAFIVALEGKTVSPTFSAAVQKWGSQISDLLTQLSALASSAAKSASTTVVTQIQSVMQTLSTTIGSILQDVDVTDPSTTSKFEQFVQLAIGAVGAVLAFIPLAVARIQAATSSADLEATDKDAKDTIDHCHKAAKTTYHAIVTQPTTQLDVNSALSTLPQELP